MGLMKAMRGVATGYLGARVTAWKNKRNASTFPPVFYYTSAVPLFAPVGKVPTQEQQDRLNRYQLYGEEPLPLAVEQFVKEGS